MQVNYEVLELFPTPVFTTMMPVEFAGITPWLFKHEMLSEEVPLAKGTTIPGTAREYVYRVPGKGTSEYTAKVKIDYTVDNLAFAQSDFVIINI